MELTPHRLESVRAPFDTQWPLQGLGGRKRGELEGLWN